MAHNGGAKSETFEKYRPLNKAYRHLTDDRHGRLRKLLRAMEQNPEAQFFIVAKKWGHIAITVNVADEHGEFHNFSFGKTVEGYVCFVESDRPIEMVPVRENEIDRVAHIFEMLSSAIDAQLAELVEKPIISFE